MLRLRLQKRSFKSTQLITSFWSCIEQDTVSKRLHDNDLSISQLLCHGRDRFSYWDLETIIPWRVAILFWKWKRKEVSNFICTDDEVEFLSRIPSEYRVDKGQKLLIGSTILLPHKKNSPFFIDHAELKPFSKRHRLLPPFPRFESPPLLTAVSKRCASLFLTSSPCKRKA